MRRATPALTGVLCSAIIAGLTTGCASVLDVMAGEDRSGEDRGRTFAQQHCASCHAVGRRGTSPRADAPVFGAINRDFTEPSLGRELEAISTVGHFDMPVLAIGPADRQDLVIYIKGLGG